MRRHIFLIRAFTSLIVSLVLMACIDVDSLPIPKTKENKMQSKRLCNSVTNELKFCVERQKISATQSESVILDFSLLNTSKREINVNKYNGGNYSFKITNEKNEVILTKLEQKKMKGEMSEEDKKAFVNSLVRNHQSVTLQPEETYHEKIALGEMYDFTQSGKYYVTVVRKTRLSTEKNTVNTSLETIEIEVKQPGLR